MSEPAQPAKTKPNGDRAPAGRVPASNLDAEGAVLSACLLAASDVADDVRATLPVDAFYSDANRRIFESILWCMDNNVPVDVVAVAQRLKDSGRLGQVGGTAYLGQITDATPAVANVLSHATIVRDLWRARLAGHTAMKIAAEAYQELGGSEQIQGWLEQVEEEFAGLAHMHQTSHLRKLSDVMQVVYANVSTAYHNKSAMLGTPTGFKSVDNMLNGYREGDLIVVAGRPGMGKSAYALCCAVNAAKHGFAIPYFSLEMPAEQVGMRILSSEARIDLALLRTGKLQPKDFSKIAPEIQKLSKLPIWIDDTAALTVFELRARVRRLQKEIQQNKHEEVTQNKVGLVVVDYLQLMRPVMAGRSREQEVSTMSQASKEIAKQLKVPLMSVSQLNRNPEKRPDKRPELADLRECVVGETLVCLADGRRVPIAELCGWPSPVWSVALTGKLVQAESSAVWRVGERDVLALVLASGRSLRCTPEHKILTASGWREAGSLKIGDRVALASRIPEPRTAGEWPELHLALLGQMVGDGSYLSNQPMRYTSGSEENLAIVERAAESFGCTTKRYAGRDNWSQLLLSGNGDRWHPAGVGAWFKQLGIFGQRSRDKRLPSSVFTLQSSSIAMLVAHLWATDGTISVKKSVGIAFSTASVGLAHDVAALLHRLGIVARINTIHSWFNVVVSGARDQRRFLDAVPHFGPRIGPAMEASKALADVADHAHTLPDEFFSLVQQEARARGISQRAMARMRGTSYSGSSHFKFQPSRKVAESYAHIIDSRAVKSWVDADLVWDQVASLQSGGHAVVYDMTVPGPSNWLADGLVTHNSGSIEQDADVVQFLFRPGYYDKKDPALQGWAEVLIEKQRNGPTGVVKIAFQKEFARFYNYEDGEWDHYDPRDDAATYEPPVEDEDG